jgi:tetratricopeptide (TPR) repeat protein
MKHFRTALTIAVLATATSAHSQELDDWREDLRVLATELPARHKNAFHRMTRAQWDSAVKALDVRLPQLKRHEILVEFMRLVAMVRDGHTSFAPEFDERFGFHRFPIQLYDFKDGLFIISADSAHKDIVGAKVTMIGSAPVEAAMHAVSRVISHESPNWARARAASLLAIPEVLAALGIGTDTLTAEFTVEVASRKRTVLLKGTGTAAGNAHMVAARRLDVSASAPGDVPLYRQRADDAFWYTILPDRTLYIGYRAVAFFAGMLNEEFFRRAFAAADSARVDRVVLDMRNNGGGNNFLNRFVVKEIIRRPGYDRANTCLVLIGRGVFSAAQNLVNELDYYTNCTFVGEPTGNSPNQYGDARPLILPRSQFRVMVSSLLWQGHLASDARAWFQPDVYVEVSSDDYRQKKDPVLETALRRANGPTLARQLEEVMSRDSTALRGVIDAYRYHPENKYRDIEADMNAAGYQLLRAGKTAAAITVFQSNVRLHPQSGNVYDSLGEALERADKKDEAIAAYRKALELNTNLFSSRDALRRLGATP